MSTIKQKLALKKTMENGGVVSRAMLDAGYSKAMAKNPHKLTRTKGWKELMDEFLPDDDLLRVNTEGLNAVRTISANVIVKSDDPKVRTKQASARDVDFIDVPDYAVRHKYLETAYRVKGKLDNSLKIPEDAGNVESITVTFKSKSE